MDDKGKNMRMRERIIEALTWGEPDYVPWIPKKSHTPRDPQILDRLLSKGMGISYPVSVFKTSRPNVEHESRVSGEHRVDVFRTPVGEVRQITRTGLPSEQGERGDSWVVERMIKGPDDYAAVKFMVEDEVYEPAYEGLEEMEEKVAQHGVLQTGTGYTPLMQLVVNYMGFKRLVIELRRRREKVEELLEAIDGKMKERMGIVARSPVRIVNIGDNIDGLLINPDLFEKYCVPRYQEYSEILHRGGKIAQSHMDGRLACLKDLIPETGLDVVQAFTPPPIGDLPLSEARRKWGEELAIWVNVPEVIFYRPADGVKSYIRSLLREAAPGRGLVLGITETVPPDHRDRGLEAITEVVMEEGRIPIRL